MSEQTDRRCREQADALGVPLELWLKTTTGACFRLKCELEQVFSPALLRWARWLDRILRHWPWLYRRLAP